MEITKKQITTNRRVKCGNTQIGVDGDIIVPDIKPDILKILQADGNAHITSTTIADGKLTVSGRIDVCLLYVPDREEEKIKSIQTSFDFSTRIDKAEFRSEMYADVNADIEKIDFQILNSRKLRIKSIVTVSYDVSEQKNLSLALCPASEENAEVLLSPIDITELVGIKESDFSVRESFELPPGQTAVAELLKYDAAFCDTEYKTLNGKVIVKGTVCLSCLFLDTSAQIRYCDFEAPFTEIFDIPDADDDTECAISFSISELNVKAENDSDGDTKIISTEISALVKIHATKAFSGEILEDCFVPGTKTDIVRTHSELEKNLSYGTFQTTIRDIAAPPLSAPMLKGIYNVFAHPVIETCETKEDFVSVKGKIMCDILYVSDSEDLPVCSMTKAIPFSCQIDAPGSAENSKCDLSAKIAHTSYNLSASGEAEIRCIFFLSAKVTLSGNIQLIESVEEIPLEGDQKHGIVIYFVQRGDTLWDISKRYSASGAEILSVNGLDETSILEVGSKLLIPTP